MGCRLGCWVRVVGVEVGVVVLIVGRVIGVLFSSVSCFSIRLGCWLSMCCSMVDRFLLVWREVVWCRVLLSCVCLVWVVLSWWLSWLVGLLLLWFMVMYCLCSWVSLWVCWVCFLLCCWVWVDSGDSISVLNKVVSMVVMLSSRMVCLCRLRVLMCWVWCC